MNKAVEKQIREIFNSVFKKIYKRNLDVLAKGSTSEMIKDIEKLRNSKQYREFCKKVSIELAKKGLNNEKGLWKEYFRIAKKRGIIAIDHTYTEFEQKLFEKAVKRNFKMVKSIPEEVKKSIEFDYVKTVMNNVAKGTATRGSLERVLKKAGSTKANLVARTETAKLQSEITQDRAKELGGVAYTWKSSRDMRTRPSHKAMNGVIVFWRPEGQKPLLDNMRGNAGEFPNCRCKPLPIFHLDDLTKPTYLLYDYRFDKVITVGKDELKYYLEKKSL